MFCTKCGFELPDGTVFCTSCGAKQKQAAVESENLQNSEVEKQRIIPKWNLKKEKQTETGTTLPGGKKKRGKMVGACVAGVAVISIMIGAVVLNQPKIKLMRSAYKTYQDIVKTESGVGEYLGWNDLRKEIQTGKTHHEFTFAGKKDGERLGLRAVINMDKKSGETGLMAYPLYKNSELTELLMYRNKERTVMAVPDLYDGSFYFMNEDMMRKFRDSALNSYLKELTGIGFGDDGDSMSEDDREALNSMMSRFMEQSSDTWKQMGKNITVEKNGSKNFTVGGKSKKCKAYEVTIPKKDMKNVLKEVSKFVEKDDSVKQMFLLRPRGYASGTSREQMERILENGLMEMAEEISEFGDSLEDDLVVTLYTGPKGRLVSMEGEYEFALNPYDMPVSLTLSLLGAGNPLDVVELEYDYTDTWQSYEGKAVSDKYTISLFREQTYNKSSRQLDDSGEFIVKNVYNDNVHTNKIGYSLSLNQKSGAWDLSLKNDYDTAKLEGTFSDVKKGKGFNLVLDKLKFSDDYFPTFEGQYVVGALGKEPLNVIPADVGDEIDLFDMGLSEIQKIGENVVKKLSSKLARAGLEKVMDGVFGSSSKPAETTAAPAMTEAKYSY